MLKALQERVDTLAATQEVKDRRIAELEADVVAMQAKLVSQTPTATTIQPGYSLGYNSMPACSICPEKFKYHQTGQHVVCLSCRRPPGAPFVPTGNPNRDARCAACGSYAYHHDAGAVVQKQQSVDHPNVAKGPRR
jgi:hypothetical protein